MTEHTAHPSSRRTTDARTTADVGATPLVEARGITKRFPGVLALDAVDFRLLPGEVHALVGENGAGKSTLMKILGGVHTPDEGTLLVDGAPVTLTSPLDAGRHGIAVIHQELSLLPDLTIAQNIHFGREPHRASRFIVSDRAMRTRARALLARLGLDLDPTTLVGDLTVGLQQMIEIAKALSQDARILIMDEPTAALTVAESETLFRVMADFVSPTTGIVYISHRMEEIGRIADTITVMRDGRWISTDPARSLGVPDIIERMVGRQVSVTARPTPLPEGREKVLEVEHLSTRALLRDVSFDLRRGEILGFAGLVGAGRTEVARALIGVDPTTSGEVRVRGEKVRISDPEDAVAHSIAYLSEDRKGSGLLLDKDLVENTALPSLAQWARHGVIDDARAEGVAVEFTQRLRIKTPSVRRLARNLSGGNQQKVVLAKWLARDCDILFVDEPTRGIDVGAKEEIHGLLEHLAAEGTSVIVISSDIAEVQRLAHRVVVMWQGRVTGVLDNAEATQTAIMSLATGQGLPEQRTDTSGKEHP